jgi:hypothetical protein
MFFTLPFHAAGQCNKERISDSVERQRLLQLPAASWELLT